jgi:N-acyl-L-homoserine lactone synthetase
LFYTIRANNDLLRDYVYRIRYQVFCLEMGFEFESDARREIDMDDPRSVHFLVMRNDGGAVAAARMILPEIGKPLPTERVADHLEIVPADITRMGEISRMTILPPFRRQLSIHNLIIRELITIAADYNLVGAIAVMEPVFIRYWNRLGIHFKPIGGLIEHHGVRQPCYILMKDVESRLQAA